MINIDETLTLPEGFSIEEALFIWEHIFDLSKEIKRLPKSVSIGDLAVLAGYLAAALEVQDPRVGKLVERTRELFRHQYPQLLTQTAPVDVPGVEKVFQLLALTRPEDVLMNAPVNNGSGLVN